VIHVEGDASSASYFLAAGAIGGGPVRVEGWAVPACRAMWHFAEALQQMGARIEKGAELDRGARAGERSVEGQSNLIATISLMRR